jgi:hypothetical protein
MKMDETAIHGPLKGVSLNTVLWKSRAKGGLPGCYYCLLLPIRGIVGLGMTELGILDPEVESTTVLQKVRNYLPKDRVSHSRYLESSRAPHWEPQILNDLLCVRCRVTGKVRLWYCSFKHAGVKCLCAALPDEIFYWGFCFFNHAFC